MVKKYRIIFLGLYETRGIFSTGMSQLGVPETVVEQIISKAPVILKEDLSPGYAKQYADAVHHAGGKVDIQEYNIIDKSKQVKATLRIEPLENFTMCPQCGHKQLKTDVCNRCKLVLKP